MKTTYLNGLHCITHNGTTIRLTDKELARFSPHIGEYLDTLPEDVYERVEMECMRVDLELMDVEGRLN